MPRAFLAALTVTGAGRCPYCPLAARRAPSPAPPAATPAPPKCECCHARPARADRDGAETRQDKPASPKHGPCDHTCSAEPAIEVGAGKRPDPLRACRAVDATADAGDPLTDRLTSESARPATGRPAPPLGLCALRYSCAFRC
jgi:hypothetical protein